MGRQRLRNRASQAQLYGRVVRCFVCSAPRHAPDSPPPVCNVLTKNLRPPCERKQRASALRNRSYVGRLISTSNSSFEGEWRPNPRPPPPPPPPPPSNSGASRWVQFEFGAGSLARATKARGQTDKRNFKPNGINKSQFSPSFVDQKLIVSVPLIAIKQPPSAQVAAPFGLDSLCPLVTSSLQH